MLEGRKACFSSLTRNRGSHLIGRITTERKPDADKIAEFTFANCANKLGRVSWVLALAYSQRRMHGPLRRVDFIIGRRRVGLYYIPSMGE